MNNKKEKKITRYKNWDSFTRKNNTHERTTLTDRFS
jgi:hypothetical protein